MIYDLYHLVSGIFIGMAIGMVWKTHDICKEFKRLSITHESICVNGEFYKVIKEKHYHAFKYGPAVKDIKDNN